MFQFIKVNANRARESHDELFQISFCDLLGITRFPIISGAFELFKQRSKLRKRYDSYIEDFGS